jgi:hypothetical protein
MLNQTVQVIVAVMAGDHWKLVDQFNTSIVLDGNKSEIATQALTALINTCSVYLHVRLW